MTPALDPSWLAERRRRALADFRAAGPPDRKREAWRFTRAGPLLEGAFRVARPSGEDCPSWALAELGPDTTWRLPVVHGWPDLVAAGPPPAGVEVARIADLLRGAAGRIEPLLGAIDSGDELAALNTTLFEDGVLVRFEAGAAAARPIHLVYAGSAAPGAGTHPPPGPTHSSSPAQTTSYLRLLVIAEAGSRGQLIESFLDDRGDRHLVNAVAEVAVEAGAELDHARYLDGGANRYHIGRLAVRQGPASRYRSQVITLGGALSRLELRVVSAGEGADTVLHGLYHAGAREHVDHHTTIEHAGPRGTSTESYRGIVDGDGCAVFDGTVVVRRDAQKTSAHQDNKNLILSDRATVHTKPHLCIDADDVQCSHGATVGPPDPEPLHYLASRGIGRAQAVAMLTRGFVDHLLAEIPHPALAARAAAAFRRRLPEAGADGGEP